MSRPKGSIRQRGSSFEIKFDVRSENGGRKTSYYTFRGTREEAENKLIELLQV
jgi:hypothetical protein